MAQSMADRDPLCLLLRLRGVGPRDSSRDGAWSRSIGRPLVLEADAGEIAYDDQKHAAFSHCSWELTCADPTHEAQPA